MAIQLADTKPEEFKDRSKELRESLRLFDREDWLGLVANLVVRLEAVEDLITKRAN
jgi:hypothetical protein